jgi:geranylgeranyl diphosphate synthase, type I
MVPERAVLPERILALRAAIDDELRSFLAERRRTLEAIDADAVPLVEEIAALVDAGGKRLRPLFCLCGYRATGAEIATPILKAAAAMELLHAMALIHDDVMDESAERRGRPTTEARQAAVARERGAVRPDDVGRSAAILTGDLAAVLADDLMLSAGFATDRLADALHAYHRMRLEMAAGQFIDVVATAVGPVADVRDAPRLRRAAALRGGAYTVRGPLRVGAALAGASEAVLRALERYAEPLGEAFQLADDLVDGDAPPGVGLADIDELGAGACAALDPAVLHIDALEALAELADRVAAGARNPPSDRSSHQSERPAERPHNMTS